VILILYFIFIAEKVEAVATDEVKRRRRDPVVAERLSNRHSYPGNRLSIISSESDKRSSDSVEVLGSTSCTTTPDSELPDSISASSFGVRYFIKKWHEKLSKFMFDS